MFTTVLTFCLDMTVRVLALVAACYFGYKFVMIDYCDPEDEEEI